MSRNHAQIGSAWRREHDKRVGPEPTCHYLGRLPGACKGGVMERHHVIELQDGGRKNDTVPACHEHHRRVTAMNKELRTGIPLVDEAMDEVADSLKGLRPKTRPKSTGQPRGRASGQKAPATVDKRWTLLDIHLVATVLVLLVAGALRWLDMSGQAWAVLAGWVAACIGNAYWTLTRRARRDEVAQIVSLSVRGLKTDPRFIRASGHRWRFRKGLLADAYRGRVWFPDHDVLRDPAAQKRVEVEFGTAFRARLTWPVTAKRPYFDWEEMEGLPAAETHPIPVEVAPAEEVREKIRTTIEDDLHRTMKLKVGQKLDFRIVDRDDEGPLVCTLDYPAGFQDGSADARYLVQERITAQFGGLRFIAEWNRRAEGKRLTLTRRPPLPKEVPFRFPEADERLNSTLIPLGIDEAHRERSWNLQVHPHMIFAGATGAGKSYTLAELIYQLLIRGWQLILIDGKGTTFAPFRRWPGVVGYGLATDPESVAHWMEQGKHIAEERYRQIIDHDAKPSSFPRLMVIIDELTEANEIVAEWWKVARDPKEDPKDHPGIGAWASVARKGREGGVHLLLATQQPNASESTLGSTETRSNLAGRFFLGPTDQFSAGMMFGRGDLGRDIPEDSKGRGTLKVSPEEPGVEVQTYFTPRPLPSGKIEAADEDFFDRLMPLVNAAQGKVKRVTPAGGTIDVRPDRRIDPTSPATQRTLPLDGTVDVFQLADMLRDQEMVEVWLDGEFFKVVEVIGDEEAEITHVDGEGKQHSLVVDDSARFELRDQP